jgi:glycosyltransferase involved in cell wall biosynthesis
MRILLAVHQFLPEFRAGTETLTLRTGQELQRRGHLVWVLTGGEHDVTSPALHCYEQDGLAVIRMNVQGPPSPLRGGFAQTYRRTDLCPLLDQVIDMVRPDLVHLFHLRRLTLSLADRLAERRLPVVASLTDYWFGCLTGQLQFPESIPCSGPDPGSVNCLRHAATKLYPPAVKLPHRFWSLLAWGLGRWSRGGLAISVQQLQDRPGKMRQSLHHFGRVLVPSRLMLNTFASLGFSIENFRVCAYGIDCSGLEDLPPREHWIGPHHRPLRVSFIGTLNKAKGAHVLVDAVKRLHPCSPLEVRIYGSLEEHPLYGRQLIGQVSRLSMVSLEGVFPPDRVYSVLAATDLLVIPSLWRENSPLILLQALASGVPVLASDVEGMADHIQPGINGHLFTPGRSDLLAQLLHRFLEDPTKLQKICDQGGTPRTVSDYVDQLEMEYQSLA